MRPRAVSSRNSVASRKLPPEPPYSSGICSPYQPSSPIRAATSSEWPSSATSKLLARREVADRLDEVVLLVGQVEACGHASRRGSRGLKRLSSRSAITILCDLVGPVGDAQPAALAPHAAASGMSSDMPSAPCTCIARSSTLLVHLRGDHLDHRDVLAGGALALGVHLPGGVQHHQARGVDLHARLGDEVLDELLLGELAAERLALVRAPAHQLEGALGRADRAHAVVDAARARAGPGRSRSRRRARRAGCPPARGSPRRGPPSGRGPRRGPSPAPAARR